MLALTAVSTVMSRRPPRRSISISCRRMSASDDLTRRAQLFEGGRREIGEGLGRTAREILGRHAVEEVAHETRREVRAACRQPGDGVADQVPAPAAELRAHAPLSRSAARRTVRLFRRRGFACR
jgi:hypothetical protein